MVLGKRARSARICVQLSRSAQELYERGVWGRKEEAAPALRGGVASLAGSACARRRWEEWWRETKNLGLRGALVELRVRFHWSGCRVAASGRKREETTSGTRARVTPRGGRVATSLVKSFFSTARHINLRILIRSIKCILMIKLISQPLP
jgi:hypothetical protein